MHASTVSKALEKSLKAFLIYNGIAIEKTHDVVFLQKKCANLDLAFSTFDAKNINLYAVGARYPDASLAPEIEDAQYFYELAKQVYTLVEGKLIFDISDSPE